jgi:hypothetical protein
VSPNSLARATTAKSKSAPTWAMIMTSWMRAESSVPMTQMAVITTMIITANTVIAAFELATDWRPKNRYVYRAATSARDPMTRIPVTQIAQPPIQPSHGPIARVTHENVVPQSWSARFM